MLLSLNLVQFLQEVLARFEFDAGAWCDHAAFAGAWIASQAFGLLPGGERSETLQGDRVTFLQGLGDDVQTGIDNIV